MLAWKCWIQISDPIFRQTCQYECGYSLRWKLWFMDMHWRWPNVIASWATRKSKVWIPTIHMKWRQACSSPIKPASLRKTWASRAKQTIQICQNKGDPGSTAASTKQVRSQTQPLVYTHIYIYTCTHTCNHTHASMYIHTIIYIHIYVYKIVYINVQINNSFTNITYDSMLILILIYNMMIILI